MKANTVRWFRKTKCKRWCNYRTKIKTVDGLGLTTKFNMVVRLWGTCNISSTVLSPVVRINDRTLRKLSTETYTNSLLCVRIELESQIRVQKPILKQFSRTHSDRLLPGKIIFKLSFSCTTKFVRRILVGWVKVISGSTRAAHLLYRQNKSFLSPWFSHRTVCRIKTPRLDFS